MAADAAGFGLAEAVEAAERWAIFDPDPSTRGEIDSLVPTGDPLLAELFAGRLSFGTAGLRAAVGPGPNRMNALVVRQTTAGVMAWLAARGVDAPVVVIGFDARVDSQRFASHAAAAVLAAGGVPRLADAPVPTPVVAHALIAEGAAAGIVVTASHNPPDDNGYKLYLGDGRQIVSPVDDAIATSIADVAARWHEYGPAIDDAMTADAGPVLAQGWVQAHGADALATISELLGSFASIKPLTLVHTPMHGVGGEPTAAVFRSAGLAAPVPVPSQAEPDGTFPTVRFPNPEEPGALDEALAVAESIGADAVLAQDPDADRLALAVRDRPGRAMVALSGDELGVLLGDHLLRHTDGPRLVARSVVSSRLLDKVGAAAGATCAVTLTGFKWLARAVDDHPGVPWLFGYEEAIGYAVGGHVRDKDGVTAALAAAHVLYELESQGQTVWDRLDALALAHGVHASRPVVERFADPDRMAAVVAAIVESPPDMLGGATVVATGPIGGGLLPDTPGIELHTADETRVIVRPSGTEPKLKAYAEVIEPVAVAAEVALARSEAQTRLDRVCADVQRLFAL